MAKIEQVISGLANGATYYCKVFTVNPEGRVNNRIDLGTIAVIPVAFPAEPTEYKMIGTYTASQVWEAPEDGWFKIELHGASGNGGETNPANIGWYRYTDDDDVDWYYAYSGPSGGGGAYVCSVVKLKKGDVVSLVCGNAGANTTAAIASSMETHSLMQAISGGNGVAGTSSSSFGTAGTGGVASGGNISNLNGNNGGYGNRSQSEEHTYDITAAMVKGGAAAHPDGNAGGNGAYITGGTRYALTSGKPGYFKIYRGNTNSEPPAAGTLTMDNSGYLFFSGDLTIDDNGILHAVPSPDLNSNNVVTWNTKE